MTKAALRHQIEQEGRALFQRALTAGSFGNTLVRSVDGAFRTSVVLAMEELEEAAKLVILTCSMAVRLLDAAVIADLDRHVRLK